MGPGEQSRRFQTGASCLHEHSRYWHMQGDRSGLPRGEEEEGGGGSGIADYALLGWNILDSKRTSGALFG